MSTVGEWLLRRLSHTKQNEGTGEPEWDRGGELRKVLRKIPWFPAMVRGGRVLDFGCGSGYQVARMAELGAVEVTGIEIQEDLRIQAAEVAERYGVRDQVTLLPELPAARRGTFDVVLSQNSMEHFSEPEAVLASMREALAPGGRIVTVFGPLWWHPYGAHIHFFTRIPWPHLWFSEETIMAVRADFRDDGAERFEEVEGGLNRMTVGKFRRLVREAGLRFDFFKVEAPRDLQFLVHLPGIRELFAKNVFAILRADDARS